MPLIHVNASVNTIATKICQLPTGVQYTAVQVYNRDNQPIYIGDANVTTAVGPNGGSVLASNSSVQIWMNAGDALYAISTGGTAAGAVSIIYSA
jgi:hypothetical protein